MKIRKENSVVYCRKKRKKDSVGNGCPFLTGKDLPQSQTVRDLLRVVTLCNRAHFKPDQPDGPIYAKTVVGDASESALLKFIEAVDGHTDEIRANHVPAVEIPFNSTTKFQVTKNWPCLGTIGYS